MKGKKILLGITGSIAAYKSAMLVRLLVKAGAEVKVVMTDSAREFITPLTLSVLSKHPVICNSHDRKTGEWNSHIDLGLWADLFLIAPASANTISKMAVGIADSHLLACYLSARCPVVIAPAMDLDMFMHPAVQKNLTTLSSFRQHLIIHPVEGELASGLIGEGRMEEPEQIVRIAENFLFENLPLRGKKALVTAGPTHEAIDPVRFIGNRSSGRMGFAIAEELARRGAEVKLITGPSNLLLTDQAVERCDVKSADEMYLACMEDFDNMDIIVMSAAVADYRPGIASAEKIKKENNKFSLPLVPTTDILKSMGERKKADQLLVGFALESNDEIANAKEKLRKKNLDLIVLNSLNDEGAGFEVVTNKITIIDRAGKETAYDKKPKTEVARDLVDVLMNSIKK